MHLLSFFNLLSIQIARVDFVYTKNFAGCNKFTSTCRVIVPVLLYFLLNHVTKTIASLCPHPSLYILGDATGAELSTVVAAGFLDVGHHAVI